MCVYIYIDTEILLWPLLEFLYITGNIDLSSFVPTYGYPAKSEQGSVSGIPGCRDKDPSIHLGMNAARQQGACWGTQSGAH